MAKRRVDVLLVERGLAESREKAQAAILAGSVLLGQRPVAKPGTFVDEGAELTVLASPRYVSGVIRDPLLQATLISCFVAWAVGQGYRILGLARSPLLGPAGNQEFFFLL